MTDPDATDATTLDDALERVVVAARAHLAAVKAAAGAIDDDGVWHSYLELNNRSAEYDELLLDAFGEVTPWDTEPIDPYGVEQSPTAAETGGAPDDAYGAVVSVRHRRDYRVPSVSALLAAGVDAARRLAVDEALPAPETVGEAVLGLVQAGDGSLASLDIPALEPLDGVVTVAEVAEPLDLAAAGDAPGADLFTARDDDRIVGRLDEHPYVDLADLDDGDVDGDVDDEVEDRRQGRQ